MEIPREQLARAYCLGEAFFHGSIQELDILKAHDGPEGWIRVQIIPFYFWLDQEGICRHVQERNGAFPGVIR